MTARTEVMNRIPAVSVIKHEKSRAPKDHTASMAGNW